MASSRCGIQPRDWRRVGEPIGETERVVDVLDVAPRDAEVFLDHGRREGEVVDHQIRCA